MQTTHAEWCYIQVGCFSYMTQMLSSPQLQLMVSTKIECFQTTTVHLRSLSLLTTSAASERSDAEHLSLSTKHGFLCHKPWVPPSSGCRSLSTDRPQTILKIPVHDVFSQSWLQDRLSMQNNAYESSTAGVAAPSVPLLTAWTVPETQHISEIIGLFANVVTKITGASVIFFLNRLLHAWLILSALCGQMCYALSWIDVILSLLPYFLWNAFTTMRVYAVSGRDWHITAIVCILNVGPIVVNVIQWKKVPLIAGNAIVILVTWWKMYSLKNAADKVQVTTSLVDLLLHDGSIYFSMMLILNSLHIMMNHVAPLVRRCPLWVTWLTWREYCCLGYTMVDYHLNGIEPI
ncbi:hypothetical protein GY45DRAFT_1341093 [Cubamyces sp. BRFM 1775]|nr:hypothetical protein GY45DRAFT_1341093 [Cubamyces sp. BRFM 1775]